MSMNRHNALRQGEGMRRANALRSARHNASEIELGLLQMQILWLLKRPSHGYALMKALNELKQTKITQGTLYPALQRLEELKLVARKRAGRRHVWHLTEKGKKTMKRACAEFCATFHGIFRDFMCGRCK